MNNSQDLIPEDHLHIKKVTIITSLLKRAIFEIYLWMYDGEKFSN